MWGFVALLIAIAPPHSIRLEAEQASLVGVRTATDRPGYSGSGYVTGFTKEGDSVVFKFTSEGGIYDAVIGYRAPSGGKAYELGVNGLALSGMFATTGQTFARTSAGKVELKAGENVVTVGGGWDYYDIDYIELTPAAPASRPIRPPAALADPAASGQARSLMSRLIGGYGDRTLSGVYSYPDAGLVHRAAGKFPAILGDDLMDYSPSRVRHGASAAGTVERLIEAHKRGYAVTLSWHWNAPMDLIDQVYADRAGKPVEARWWRGFYTVATTFDLRAALEHPGSVEYRAIIKDIDAIAVQLRKLDDAGVPVLWRPLHEAEGGWFWWGAKGPEPFKQLWRLMYDRLTNYHHLHDLIWVYTSGGNMDWYPGDAYVDIVGVDLYPSDRRDPESALWESPQRRFDGKKLLAITEHGSVPDIERMRRFGVCWSYFVSWVGGPKSIPKSELRAIYTSPGVEDRPETKRK